jgi:hypothetical protein
MTEPYVEEYEKSTTALESQLALTKAEISQRCCSYIEWVAQQRKLQQLNSANSDIEQR